MSKQLHYYENAVPVSAQRHGDWTLAERADYEFADHSNSVPLVTSEFPAAAAEYAIVFTGTRGAVYPALILGLGSDENFYVDAQGKWNARYVPAFVRRYPFVFSKSKDETRLILCIDEQCAGWNQEGRGERLFDTNGERTEYLGKILRFLEDYQRQSERTQAFCRRLKELDLLESMTARFKLPSGDKAALSGFMAIDREKLQALPGETLAALAKTGELELIYVHLQSMRNFAGMLARVSGEKADTSASQESDACETEELLH